MTPLLEAREVTKSFGGGLLDRRHTVALRHFSLAPGRGPPVRHRRRRRERQRQDDAGAPPPRPPDADGGPGRLSRAGSHRHVAGGAADLPARGPGGLPGPVRGLQPVLPGGPRPDGAGRQVQAGDLPRRRPDADRGRAPRGGAPPRRDARAFPASALGRPAPARHGGARAAPPAARDPGRRARVDGGRLAPGHDPRGAPPDDARPPDPGDLHHARPGDRVPDRGEHRRAVPRRRGGSRRRGAGRQGPSPPVHAAPGRLDPAAGRRADVDGRRRAGPAARAPGAGAPGCLFEDRCPVGDAGVPDRRAAALPARCLGAWCPASCTRTRPWCRRTRWRRPSSRPEPAGRAATGPPRRPRRRC